jgi:hypothetical protein
VTTKQVVTTKKPEATNKVPIANRVPTTRKLKIKTTKRTKRVAKLTRKGVDQEPPRILGTLPLENHRIDATPILSNRFLSRLKPSRHLGTRGRIDVRVGQVAKVVSKPHRLPEKIMLNGAIDYEKWKS